MPTEFSSQLVDALRDFGVMRQIARVISTDSGEALQIPSITSHGTAAWIAENAAFTVSDEAFGQATLNAYKAATIMKVSEELLAGLRVRPRGVHPAGVRQPDRHPREHRLRRRRRFGQADRCRDAGLGRGHRSVGDGDHRSTSSIDLYHSLLPPYRRNAAWLIKDSTIKLRPQAQADADNQYVWQPGLQVGSAGRAARPARLRRPGHGGRDTTGLISVLFGDFSYYWIRDVNGIAFQRLTSCTPRTGRSASGPTTAPTASS